MNQLDFRRTGRLVCWLIAAAVGCGFPENIPLSQTDKAITNGVTIEGDLGVVGLVDEGFVFCSGTLIAPRIVVTAAHCVDGYDEEELQLLFGHKVDAASSTLIGVLDSRIHPSYSGQSFQYDIALLLLAAPAPLEATAWPILATPLTEAKIGSELRLVGYGIDGPYSSDPDAAAAKREGWTTLNSYTRDTLSFGPNPSQTCNGDSGGPILVTDYGVEYLVGVASAGDTDCMERAVNTRVDVNYQDFILPYLLQTTEGVAAAGETCFYDGNCIEGTCIASNEGTGSSYCTRTCDPSIDNCPAGLQCVSTAHGGELCQRNVETIQGGCSVGDNKKPTGISFLAALMLLLFLGTRRHDNRSELKQ